MTAAEDLYRRLKPRGTGTAIVTAALLAGTQLFRNTGIDSGLEPGTYVLVDILDEHGMALLDELDRFLVEYANEAPDEDWQPLEGDGPTDSLIDLITAHEPGFLAVVEENHILLGSAPRLAIQTAALIIRRAAHVLNADLGKSIVAQALVYACKHAPPPRPS